MKKYTPLFFTLYITLSIAFVSAASDKLKTDDQIKTEIYAQLLAKNNKFWHAHYQGKSSKLIGNALLYISLFYKYIHNPLIYYKKDFSIIPTEYRSGVQNFERNLVITNVTAHLLSDVVWKYSPYKPPRALATLSAAIISTGASMVVQNDSSISNFLVNTITMCTMDYSSKFILYVAEDREEYIQKKVKKKLKSHKKSEEYKELLRLQKTQLIVDKPCSRTPDKKQLELIYITRSLTKPEDENASHSLRKLQQIFGKEVKKYIDSTNESSVICSICLEEIEATTDNIKNITELECGHAFDNACYEGLLKSTPENNVVCPFRCNALE